MQDYTVTTEFTLGTNGQKLIRGTSIKFDGSSTAIYAGQTFAVPGLVGAIRRGWIVPAGEYTPESRGPREVAPMLLGPTQHQGGLSQTPRRKSPAFQVQEDAHEVTSVRGHREQIQQRNASRQGRQYVSDAMGQDGEVVRRVSTPTKNKATLTPENAHSQIRYYEEKIQIKAGEGHTEGEMLAEMSHGERAAYLAKKEELRAKKPGADRAPGLHMPIVSGDHDPNLTIPTYGNKTGSAASEYESPTSYEMEGIRFNKQVAGAVPPEGVRFASTPKPMARAEDTVVGTADPADVRRRLSMAKAICPDFPANYDFGAPARKKLARIEADYEDRPDVIRAIYMAESDALKAQLVELFPQAFEELPPNRLVRWSLVWNQRPLAIKGVRSSTSSRS